MNLVESLHIVNPSFCDVVTCDLNYALLLWECFSNYSL